MKRTATALLSPDELLHPGIDTPDLVEDAALSETPAHMIPPGWRIDRFDRLAILQRGFDLPASARTHGQIPVVGSNGVVGWHNMSRVNGPGVVTGRSGSIGESIFVESDYWPLNTALYIRDFHGNDPRYVHYFLQWFDLSRFSGGVSVPTLNRNMVHGSQVAIPPLQEQEKIAALLWKLQQAIQTQDTLLRATRDLKAAAMQRLFTHGLRGEPLKNSEIGPIPESWSVSRLDARCDVVSSSLSYTDLLEAQDSDSENAVTAHGIKVSDMNLQGNELQIVHANLIKRVQPSFAERKMVPAETVVFPKRGAAIATNKKRLTTAWTVLDPNLIGVRPKPGFDHRYLFHWFEQFDLRTITESGPTPQLNKKNLTPLQLPVPATREEQRDIAAALATIDRKLAHHQRKRATLNDLFQTLLQQLMTAQLRVADLDIDTSEVTAPAQGVAA